MKKSSLLKTLLALSLLWSVFIINGCKKEATIKPTITPIAVIAETIDSANFLKGLLGDEPVKFEGNAVYYKGYVDPDSAGHHDNPGNTGDPNGSTHDHDSYYQSGSKWVTINQTGLQLSTASVELRSLAVRVFVSPISASSNNYFNLLSQATYAVATSDNPSKGAYVTIRLQPAHKTVAHLPLLLAGLI